MLSRQYRSSLKPSKFLAIPPFVNDESNPRGPKVPSHRYAHTIGVALPKLKWNPLNALPRYLPYRHVSVLRHLNIAPLGNMVVHSLFTSHSYGSHEEGDKFPNLPPPLFRSPRTKLQTRYPKRTLVHDAKGDDVSAKDPLGEQKDTKDSLESVQDYQGSEDSRSGDPIDPSIPSSTNRATPNGTPNTSTSVISVISEYKKQGNSVLAHDFEESPLPAIPTKEFKPDKQLESHGVESLGLLLARSTDSLAIIERFLLAEKYTHLAAMRILNLIRRREIIAATYIFLGFKTSSQVINEYHNSSRVNFLHALRKCNHVDAFLHELQESAILNIQSNQPDAYMEKKGLLDLISLRNEDSDGYTDISNIIHRLSIADAIDCCLYYQRELIGMSDTTGNKAATRSDADESKPIVETEKGPATEGVQRAATQVEQHQPLAPIAMMVVIMLFARPLNDAARISALNSLLSAFHKGCHSIAKGGLDCTMRTLFPSTSDYFDYLSPNSFLLQVQRQKDYILNKTSGQSRQYYTAISAFNNAETAKVRRAFFKEAEKAGEIVSVAKFNDLERRFQQRLEPKDESSVKGPKDGVPMKNLAKGIVGSTLIEAENNYKKKTVKKGVVNDTSLAEKKNYTNKTAKKGVIGDTSIVEEKNYKNKMAKKGVVGDTSMVEGKEYKTKKGCLKNLKVNGKEPSNGNKKN